MHGSFSRADTMNFMAAIGPGFKAGYVNIGMTIAKVLGLKISAKGTLIGRVIAEALPGGTNPAVERFVERGNPDPKGLATILVGQAGRKMLFHPVP